MFKYIIVLVLIVCAILKAYTELIYNTQLTSLQIVLLVASLLILKITFFILLVHSLNQNEIHKNEKIQI